LSSFSKTSGIDLAGILETDAWQIQKAWLGEGDQSGVETGTIPTGKREKLSFSPEMTCFDEF